MNEKQAEQATGISRRNLRFYEQQGLICPARNPDNDYRDYSQKDIQDLKLIRALRMLDTPLEDVASCLRGEMTLAELSGIQEKRLQKKQREVKSAIEICRKLTSEDIDCLLKTMDAPDVHLFDDWKNDYRKVAEAEAKKSFIFTPDDAISTPAEFTQVLFQYANENNLNLVITKEGLEPEFEIDGIAYYAQRVYRPVGPIPVMMVKCDALHPELLEPPVKNGKLMRFFHNWWILLLIAVLAVVLMILFQDLLGALLVGAAMAAGVWAVLWWFRNYRG